MIDRLKRFVAWTLTRWRHLPARGPRARLGSVAVAAAWLMMAAHARAAGALPSAAPACPRPSAGALIEEPADLRSRNGVLQVNLTVRNQLLPSGAMRFCYLLEDGTQAPTLRLGRGDLLILRLRNELSLPGPDPVRSKHVHSPASRVDPLDACASGTMSLVSANLHFHGLSIPPLCHQDDVLKTSLQPGAAPFEYRFRIPQDQPPGLYWYHPHIHGFSARQVVGGASGALIVEGIERANAEVAGLAERVLVIRDQDLVHPEATAVAGAPLLVDRDGDALNTGSGGGRPAKDLSVNYVPVPYPDYPPARLVMQPGERQLWRVLNASSVTYLNLSSVFQRGTRFQAQHIGLVAVDGIPLTISGSAGHAIEWRTSVLISPGARAEVIVTAPPEGVAAMLVTRAVNTGPGGENDPTRALISMTASPRAAAPRSHLPANAEPLGPENRAWLGDVAPVRTRKLYFSEDAADPNDPNATQRFYLTVDGQAPAVFDPASSTPNIVVHQGDVEDWIIENRSSELHAFHIHQVRFEVMEWVGLVVNEPFLRDTINIPFNSGGANGFPSVRLRMDFRGPNAVGTFPYHCHLLDHEDGGMMGLVRVEPAAPPAVSTP